LKRKWWIGLTTLVVVLLGVTYTFKPLGQGPQGLISHEQDSAVGNSLPGSSSLPGSQASGPGLGPGLPDSLAPFETQFQSRLEEISQTTENPELVENDLDQFGQSLGPDDLGRLKEKALSAKSNGDEVGLSLDLLGRSDSPIAEAALLDAVLHSPGLKAREGGTLQLLALEGLMSQAQRKNSPQALQKVMSESGDSLISKRAAQGLGALKGENPWPSETDDNALESLLENQNHH